MGNKPTSYIPVTYLKCILSYNMLDGLTKRGEKSDAKKSNWNEIKNTQKHNQIIEDQNHGNA